jgi:hypothetical protein
MRVVLDVLCIYPFRVARCHCRQRLLARTPHLDLHMIYTYQPGFRRAIRYAPLAVITSAATGRAEPIIDVQAADR